MGSSSAREFPRRAGRDGFAPLVRAVIATRRRFSANQPPRPVSPPGTSRAADPRRGQTDRADTVG